MLTGFRAQNHPQQTGARGALDEVDDRGTHPVHFAEFDAAFGPFTLDVAAAPHNAKCDRYFTRADDGLTQPWAGERVWCNPPYSDLGAWLAKAWAEVDSTLGIVMLLPANRVEQRWWQDHVEPRRDKPGGQLRVRFLPGRMRFQRPGVVTGPKGDRPPFGCCLLIFTPIPQEAETDELPWRVDEWGIADGPLTVHEQRIVARTIHEAFCWAEDVSHVGCDRAAHHRGRHSWQQAPS